MFPTFQPASSSRVSVPPYDPVRLSACTPTTYASLEAEPTVTEQPEYSPLALTLLAAETAGVSHVFTQMLSNPTQCEKQLAATLHAWGGPGKLRMSTLALEKWQLFLPAQCGKELATSSYLRLLHRCVYGSEAACSALLACKPFMDVLFNQVLHIRSANYLPPLLWLLQGLTATSAQSQTAIFVHPHLLETLLYRAVQKTSLVSVACATLMYNVIHCREDLAARLKQLATGLTHDPSRQFAEGLLRHLSPVVHSEPEPPAAIVLIEDSGSVDEETVPLAVLEALPCTPCATVHEPSRTIPVTVAPVFDDETRRLVDRASLQLQSRGASLKSYPSNFEANFVRLCACKDFPDVFSFGYCDIVNTMALHIKDKALFVEMLPAFFPPKTRGTWDSFIKQCNLYWFLKYGNHWRNPDVYIFREGFTDKITIWVEARWKPLSRAEIAEPKPVESVPFTAASARTAGQFGFMDHLVAFCNSQEFAVHATAKFLDNAKRTCILSIKLTPEFLTLVMKARFGIHTFQNFVHKAKYCKFLACKGVSNDSVPLLVLQRDLFQPFVQKQAWCVYLIAIVLAYFML